jgi:hypothetical protein
MKNINVVTSLEATDGNSIITQYVDNVKTIPVDKEKHTKIFVNFLSTIINGKEKFFEKQKEVNFRLIITDDKNQEYILLTDFTTELSIDSPNYYKNEYVDFIVENKDFVFNLELSKSKLDGSLYYLTTLVKDRFSVNERWIVQSSMPIHFQIENE